MSRLIHTEFWRLRKNLLYFLCFLFLVGYAVLVHVSEYQNMRSYGYQSSLESCFFASLPVVGFVFAVFVSLFVGTQYADGAIRNRLIIGLGRRDIYLSSFFVNAVAVCALTVATYLVGFLLGVPLFGEPQIPWSNLFLSMASGLFMSVSFASIFHMIAMVNSNKTNSAVFCILLSFLLFFFCMFFYQGLMQPKMIDQMVMQNGENILETVKNPAYLTGFKRTLYQTILDILPPGQAIQVCETGIAHIWRMIGYSALTTVITTGVGMALFQKKDIK